MALEDNILDVDQLTDNSYKPNVADYTVNRMTRFSHFVIDTILIYSVFFGVMIALKGSSETFQLLMDKDDYSLNLIIYSSYLSYYIFMEFYFGKTVGKMLTKSTVVREDGGKLTFGQAVGRSFCHYIPFNALSFLSSNAVGWHDTISKTRVVKDVFLEHHSEHGRYDF